MKLKLIIIILLCRHIMTYSYTIFTLFIQLYFLFYYLLHYVIIINIVRRLENRLTYRSENGRFTINKFIAILYVN